jgi:dihydropteroate synthase
MTKIVGILNFTPDSFSQDGKLGNVESALKYIDKLFTDGADIIDIGAEATSYGATLLTADEEWDRLKPLLEQAPKENISIDTYHFETAQKAIDLGYSVINDVSGGRDERMLKLIATNQHVKYVLMHCLMLPANRDVRIKQVNEIYTWAKTNIEKCIALGIKKEQLVFDPGLGFTTYPQQSLNVIKNCELLKQFGVETYIGHSRKTVFEEITPLPPSERDLETVAASLYMFGKVDYLRVHNVEMHRRAFNVWSNLVA